MKLVRMLAALPFLVVGGIVGEIAALFYHAGRCCVEAFNKARTTVWGRRWVS